MLIKVVLRPEQEILPYYWAYHYSNESFAIGSREFFNSVDSIADVYNKFDFDEIYSIYDVTNSEFIYHSDNKELVNEIEDD